MLVRHLDRLLIAIDDIKRPHQAPRHGHLVNCLEDSAAQLFLAFIAQNLRRRAKVMRNRA